MALKETLNQYPGQEGSLPPDTNNGKPRLFALWYGASLLGLGAGCVPSQQPPPEKVAVATPTPSPQPTPEIPKPNLTPTSELGETIPDVERGETLSLGGVNGEIKRFSTSEIAQLLGKDFKEWTIIGGPNNEFFNVIFSDTEGKYHLILPHAPSNYQWDEENQVWTNPQNPNEILFPQVALPGGWNEERQMAGPTAVPDMAVMLRDPNGNIQVGVIYQNEVLKQAGINPQMNPESYLLLSDGRYLYLGPPKNLTLQQGQTIEAVYDENSQLRYHRITNPDGSWFMVLTSWDQVTNPQQVEHMFKPTGVQIGDEITDIPYPPDGLLDLTNPEAPIPQFANALNNAGIDLTSEQIDQGITYVSTKEDGTPLVDQDGNPFVVAVYNLDPSLFPKQYRDLAGPIPLLIAQRGENGWRWERARPNNVFNLVNIPVGVYLEPGRNNDSINKIATQNFNALVLPIYWHVMLKNPNNINFSLPDSINTLANQSGMPTFGGALLWQNPDFLPDWVKNSNLTQEQINEIIRLIIQHYPTTTAWIVVNEPYPGDFFASRFGYPDYIIKAFLAARKYTNRPLILNDFGIETSGQKYQNIRNLVDALIKEGIVVDGIGIQMHINPQNPPSTNALVQNFRSWGVPVYITELDCPTENEQLRAEIFRRVIEAALESGVVSQINFWGLGSASWQENATLFNNNNEPNLSYFIILSTVVDYLRR